MADDPAPLLSEQMNDGYGSYRQDWYCEPPAEGVDFIVTRSSWTPDRKIRKIYEFKVRGAW